MPAALRWLSRRRPAHLDVAHQVNHPAQPRLSSASRAYALGNTSVSASSTVCSIIGLPRLGLQSRPARRARGTQDTFKARYSCRVHASAQRVGHAPKFRSAISNIRFYFFSHFCVRNFAAFAIELARPSRFPTFPAIHLPTGTVKEAPATPFPPRTGVAKAANPTQPLV